MDNSRDDHQNYDEGDDSLKAGIFEDTSYEANNRPAKDFRPWHHPRKHFVRLKQWYAQITYLIRENKNIDTLSYLGLPGVDLLDLRLFQSRLSSKKIKLKFIGFNRAAKPDSNDNVELNISLDEVRRSDFVDPQSNIIFDDFADIGRDRSIAWRSTLEHGPFDVVNIDLCDGFCQHSPGTLNGSYYEAVNKLLSLQTKHKRSWLLLITTRVDAPCIDLEVQKILLNKYLKNLSESNGFREQSLSLFKIGDQTDVEEAIKTADGLANVFLAGLCKWLFSIATGHAPLTKVQVADIMGYCVSPNAKHEDLISIALKFTPQFHSVQDGDGLSGNKHNAQSESELAIQALKKISSKKHVDDYLRDNVDVFNEMLNESAALLSSARYDADKYLSEFGVIYERRA